MFEKLLAALTTKPVHGMALVTSIVANVINTFEKEFANDANAHDAAIDTLIDLLKMHKNAKASAPSTPPQA